MGTRADELKAQIDTTRADLTDTMNQVGERVSPGRMIARRRDRARQKLSTIRQTIMGAVEPATSAASSLPDRASSMVTSAADSVRQAPQAAVTSTQGDPLAAGLIAFGAGLLVASVVPPSRPEQQAAGQVLEQAQPVLEQARTAANQVADEVKQSATEATQELRTAASDAAGTVADDAKGSAEEVRKTATEAADKTKNE